MKQTLLFFALLITCTTGFSQPETFDLDASISRALSEKLYLDRQWINLGHYKKSLWGGWVSEQDNPHFFASVEGKTDPEKELVATIRAFYSGKKRIFKSKSYPDEYAICQYPARWLWLSKVLGLPEPTQKLKDCEGYTLFKKRASAKSVTLVFSSYYIDNPSSAFGHSLLRINKRTHKDSKNESELLDLGINYAANPTTYFPLVYSIGGLAGFFDGTFTALPYYNKVREYNDADSRDLWEYNLNLSQEEVDMLVAHTWELGFSSFDYYFFTSNCSYHMITLIEAAAPRLDMLSRLPLWVIPADTVKVVAETDGLVESVEYRPSIHTQLTKRLDILNEKGLLGEYNKLRDNFDPKLLSEDLNDEEKAAVLDAVIDLFDKKYFKDLVADKKKIRKQKYKLLVARSRLDSIGQLKISAPADKRPDKGHGSARFRVMHAVSTDGDHGYEVAQRFALHDFIDPFDGYPESAKIQFFNFVGTGSYEEGDFFIRELGFFEVQTLRPWSAYEWPIAWKMSLGLKNVTDQRCDECLAGALDGAVGFSLQIWSYPQIMPYLLAGVSGRTSSSFNDDKFSFDAGPIFGIRAVMASNLILFAESSVMWTHQLNQRLYKTEAMLRWGLDDDWSVDIGYRDEFQLRQFILGANYYF